MLEHFLQFVGRFHPLIVHLPIGILLLAISVELYSWKKKLFFHSFLPILWGAGFVSAILSTIVGLCLKAGGGYNEDALNLHQNFGIVLTVISGIAFFAVKFDGLKKAKLPVTVITLFLLIGTGHFGGNLTHGSDYLTQPLQAMFSKPIIREIRKPVTDINKAVVYLDLVEPIFYKRCQKCHGGSKQKGNLRMDSPEFILKGGKHGEVLNPGNAEKSELFTRLLLPEEDDKRMPPKGKEPLKENEIELIRWWIEAAKGDFKVTVAQVQKDKKTEQLLAGFIKGGSGENEISGSKSKPEIPNIKVPAPKAEDVKSLESIGVAISPLTADQSFLAANSVNNSNFADADMNKLLKVKDQLIWLDLSDTKITDKSIDAIVQCKNLTRLSLDNTAITDAGLEKLKSLKNLQHLNLYSTSVSDKGLVSLQMCRALETLHLWETKVTPEGVAVLKKSLGDSVEINYESGT